MAKAGTATTIQMTENNVDIAKNGCANIGTFSTFPPNLGQMGFDDVLLMFEMTSQFYFYSNHRHTC